MCAVDYYSRRDYSRRVVWLVDLDWPLAKASVMFG